ncbi:MAG: hypothetical protein CL933_17580 [Deltaproteobacteria bacterium]|nr:hypothetical protein [Deltaproteobacteria bacterium]
MSGWTDLERQLKRHRASRAAVTYALTDEPLNESTPECVDDMRWAAPTRGPGDRVMLTRETSSDQPEAGTA